MPYPPANVRQALMTTVSRKAASALLSGEEYLPRPRWVLGNEGGKTLIELVLLNLVRIGLCVCVCVLTKTPHDRAIRSCHPIASHSMPLALILPGCVCVCVYLYLLDCT